MLVFVRNFENHEEYLDSTDVKIKTTFELNLDSGLKGNRLVYRGKKFKMDSKSASRRRKYTDVNRKNVVIEKKYESEIRQYEREAAGMLSKHLHNTIQLMETMKQVKRNSGQIDSDMKGVSVLIHSVKLPPFNYCR